MRERNLYKDIVIGAAALILTVCGVQLCSAYGKEQKSYVFAIQSETELTEALVEEIKKISGICWFEPVSSAMVTIQLEEYTLETNLLGVDLETFPLNFQEAEERIVMGNASALFFGADVFPMFSDQNGKSPGQRQVQIWIKQREKLTVSIMDESGCRRTGKIFGILKSPEAVVCMDENQMKENFGKSCRTTGGYIEIRGYQNMEKAKDTLERGGFTVTPHHAQPAV